jgi:hypothetical protein
MFKLALRISSIVLLWCCTTKLALAQQEPPPLAAPATTAAGPATVAQVPTDGAPSVADAAGQPAPNPAAQTPPNNTPNGTPNAEPAAVGTPETTAVEPETSSHDFEGDPFGDATPPELVAGPISLRVLLQTRYGHTFAAGSSNPGPGYALREDNLVHAGDGFDLQRFFFRIAADPTPQLGFKAILDFAKFDGGSVSSVLKQAYGTVAPIPRHVEIAAGIFKLPFSILELDPIARYELSTLGDADDFIKNLGFGGRDVGVEVMIAPLPKPKLLRVMLGAFRGHASDEHASPVGAIGARVESKPIKGLRVGVDVVGMPHGADYKRPFDTSNKDVLPMAPDPLYPREQRFAAGKAYSADVTFSRWHTTLRVEGMLGDRVDIDTRYDARRFWAVWGIAAYRFRVGPIHLMPAARVEWLDGDRDHAGGLRRELALGLNVLFSKRIRLLFDVANTSVQSNTPVVQQPSPLAANPYLDLSNTRVVAQLQLSI